ANLQATLRSQYAMALEDLPRFLRSVNSLLYENMPEAGYGTLFFAHYQDGMSRLRYVNCGHLPPLLLRGDGTLERLESGSTVLGMFSDWRCTVGEAELGSGDTLLLYTDGVTEATSDDGREFGEAGLVEVVQAEPHLSVEQLLRRILDKVRAFSGHEQEDDIALVVARCRSSGE